MLEFLRQCLLFLDYELLQLREKVTDLLDVLLENLVDLVLIQYLELLLGLQQFLELILLVLLVIAGELNPL